MKRLISLILTLVFVTSLFTVGATVSAVDAVETKIKDAVGTLDYFYAHPGSYNGYASHIVNKISGILAKGLDGGAYEVFVRGDDYKALISRYFALDDAMLNEVLTYYYDYYDGYDDKTAYDEASDTYLIPLYGGFGGFLPDREYLGYVKNGDRYDVYYRHITYEFLDDVMENADDYISDLDYSSEIEYNGKVYKAGPDGYYLIKSYDDHGIKYTVEFTDDKVSADLKYRSKFMYLRDALPEGTDVYDYAKKLGNPDCIEYNGIIYDYSSYDGYYLYLDDDFIEKAGRVNEIGEGVRVVSYCEYTAKDLPASFEDGFSSAETFKDVKNKSWFKDAVDFVVSSGLMNGTSADRFEPNTSMSRAMLVTVLWRLAGSPAPSAKAPFTDLKQAWYKDAVGWAYENGVVNGTSDTKFSPNGNITREQMAAILYRYAQYRGDSIDNFAELGRYPDGAKVSKYAREAMAWAIDAYLITGTTDEMGLTVLDPRGSATRAQVATILARYCLY